MLLWAPFVELEVRFLAAVGSNDSCLQDMVIDSNFFVEKQEGNDAEEFSVYQDVTGITQTAVVGEHKLLLFAFGCPPTRLEWWAWSRAHFGRCAYCHVIRADTSFNRFGAAVCDGRNHISMC